MLTKTYKFSDLTPAVLESFTNEEYCWANDIEKEIDELTEERDGFKKDLNEANGLIEEFESEDRTSTEEIFLFAKWLDQNNIRAFQVTETELEFAYEKFQNEIKIPQQ